MDAIKDILAENLRALRKTAGLTQLELAEKLNYSDKSVSKWEHGDAVPDVEVLAGIAAFYGVTVDWLITQHAQDEAPPAASQKTERQLKGNRLIIALLAVSAVWIISTVIYVQLLIAVHVNYWCAFVWSVPASTVVLIVFNAIWGKHRFSPVLISTLVWTLLAALYLQILVCGYNVWVLFFIGVPLQISVVLSAGLKRKKK